MLVSDEFGGFLGAYWMFGRFLRSVCIVDFWVLGFGGWGGGGGGVGVRDWIFNRSWSGGCGLIGGEK
jgi:hypothetical protein